MEDNPANNQPAGPNARKNRVKEDYQVKLITLGDKSVGKSCLITRYFDNTFQEENLLTMGVAQKFKRITLEEKVIKLQVFDTAGQERFRTLATNYYRQANCITLVYDVTDPPSFDHVSNWVQ